MRSPADDRRVADGSAPRVVAGRAPRVVMERVLRLSSLVLLATLAWRAWSRGDPSARAESARGASPEALARWTVERPARLELTLDTLPPPARRDWLRALERAGTSLSWRASGLAPAALAVEPVADPLRPSRVWLAAPPLTHLALADALGPLDSLRIGRAGAVVTAPSLVGAVRLRAGALGAAAAPADSLVLRRVLVLGTAGWEAKFVVAALEERGWTVDARLALAPSGDVVQGAPTVRLDTARYAAVVALDSSAARWSAPIAAFVRSGGGLVASGDGAALPALAPLLPARAGARLSASPLAAASAHPRDALALITLDPLAPGAIPLERRGAATAIAARRVGRGRVVQSGYRDTWRWRMGGAGDDPVAEHRAWWASLVAQVAHAPRVPVPAPETDPAPFADAVATLGPQSSGELSAASSSPRDDPRLDPALFAALLLTLLAEWSSRRLRGAR